MSDLFNFPTKTSSAEKETADEVTRVTSAKKGNEFGYDGTIEQEKVGGADL